MIWAIVKKFGQKFIAPPNFFGLVRLCCGICTKGARAMLGARTGLQKLVCSRLSDAVSMHCMIHRQSSHRKLLQNLFKMF